jgi:hypothetical protein
MLIPLISLMLIFPIELVTGDGGMGGGSSSVEGELTRCARLLPDRMCLSLFGAPGLA